MVIHRTIRALFFFTKVAVSVALAAAAYQVYANYQSGYSGPFKDLDFSDPEFNKHVQLKAKLNKDFATPRRVDSAHTYMVSYGFRCNFFTGDAAKSRLGANEKGAILMCIYPFGGTLYPLPDKLIVLVFFDDKLMSYKFEYAIESV